MLESSWNHLPHHWSVERLFCMKPVPGAIRLGTAALRGGMMITKPQLSQFSGSVVSDSLLPHGLQHTRLPCPSPTPSACSNSCPLSWWCHPTISSSVAPSSLAFNLFQHPGLLQWVGSSHQVAKYWTFSFSISPSNEYSELISFRMDWFDLLAVQGTLKSLLQHSSLRASILWWSLWFNSHICKWLLEKP